MKAGKYKHFFARIARCAIGIVFLESAAIHFSNPWYFLVSVLKYEVVFGMMAALVAGIVPAVLATLGIWLLAGRWPNTVGFIAAALLSVFLFVQASALIRGLDIGCGCFGGEEKIGWFSVARSLVLMAGCLFVSQFKCDETSAV